MNFKNLVILQYEDLLLLIFSSSLKQILFFSFSLSGRDAGELTGVCLKFQFTRDYIATQDSFCI